MEYWVRSCTPKPLCFETNGGRFRNYAKMESMSKTASFYLQEKCAKQAREEFKLYGLDKHEFAEVSNHYNAKLNKCFMLIGETVTKSVRGEIARFAGSL